MTVETVHEFCRRILESGRLEDKLAPLAQANSADRDPLKSALYIDRPARTGPLQLHATSERLPKLTELKDPAARAVCLERFGNHELMAVELFAWALLAYPDAPPALRRGLIRVLQEEQGHVRLYLKRLEEVGSGLGQNPLGDYFWQQVPGIRASSNGLVSFLCVMGLTLEQANLDFSLLYRDTFHRHGDDPSAELLDRIHRDEIGHVRLAATWLQRLAEPGVSDVETYAKYIPFPLSAARAKGRHFHEGPRRRAGLSEEMIEFVRAARPYPRTTTASEVSLEEKRWGGVAVRSQMDGARVLFPNIGAEEGRAPRRGRREIEKMTMLWSALFERPENDPSAHPLSEPAASEPPLADSPTALTGRLLNSRGLIPWWSNPDATLAAEDHGLTLNAASSQITREVHDKAFAARVVQENGLNSLGETVRIFESEELLASGFLQRIESIVQEWPVSWQKHFVLKPRIGTTGRGWVRGLDGAVVDHGGIQRLAQRGGAVLEPWLDRVDDYSIQLWIHDDGRAEILGLTVQELSPRGMYLGNSGVVRGGQFLLDPDRESAVGDALRDAAQIIGDSAAAAGYRGACGIDAFTYRTDGGIELRPVVELNARFTGGWVVLGWVERLIAQGGIDGPVEWRFRWKGAEPKRRQESALPPSSGSSPFCIHRLGMAGTESADADGFDSAQERRAHSVPEVWLRPAQA